MIMRLVFLLEIRMKRNQSQLRRLHRSQWCVLKNYILRMLFSTRLFKVCKTIMYLVFTHDTVLLNVDTMYKSMCGLDAMKCRGKQHILQKDVYICKQILRWFLPNLSCYLVKTQHSLGEGTILVFWFEPFAEDVTICYSFNGCICILSGT